MSRGLGKIERAMLRYMEIVYGDCAGSIEGCEAAQGCDCPYGSARNIERDGCGTDELCRYVAGIYKCPADIEDYCLSTQAYSRSVYSAVLRALKSLERKGLVVSEKHVLKPLEIVDHMRWRMEYRPVSVDNNCKSAL